MIPTMKEFVLKLLLNDNIYKLAYNPKFNLGPDSSVGRAKD